LFVNEADEQGNRHLKPEKSRNSELGLDYTGQLAERDFSASVTLFRRKITDLITLDDVQWVNGQGQIQMRGFEADARLTLNDQWSVQADMTRNLTESRAGVTLNDIPSFFARSRIGFESQNRLWGAGAALRYIHDVISAKQVEYGH
ncbi:TonB-dependent receptor, partial [Staphylococcus aureus]